MPKKPALTPERAAAIAAEIIELEDRRKLIREDRLSPYSEIPFRFRWSWEVWLSDVSVTAKAVASAIWMFTGKDKAYCFPSQTSLRAMTRLGDRALRNAIYELRKAGFFHIRPGANSKSSIYTMRIPGWDHSAYPTWHQDTTSLGIEMPPISKENIHETYLSYRDPDFPSVERRMSEFRALRQKVLQADDQGIMASYLWNMESQLEHFTKVADEVGYDDLEKTVLRVAYRPRHGSQKAKGSIRTWAYFTKAMVSELTDAA